MIKADFVDKVAERTGLSKVLVKLIIDTFLVAVREALFEETRIELRNFGVFQVKRRKPGLGRNPRTGAQVEVPERLKVTFKPSRVFKSGGSNSPPTP